VLEPIRFVYFDLGNVLASFDVQRACQNVARRWAVDPADVRRLVWDSGLQDRFEHGEVSIDEFASTVRRGLKLDLATASTIELVDQLCDMFEPIEEMIDLVDTVRQSGMRLGYFVEHVRGALAVADTRGLCGASWPFRSRHFEL